MLFGVLKKWGGMVLAVATAAGAIFFAGVQWMVRRAERQRRRDNEALAVRQVNEAREAAKEQIQAIGDANEIRDKINQSNTGDAADQLRDKYSRD